MDFHVIHFDYDNQITAVNSSKVQCKEVLKPGERCTVPFETEDLSEDGRTEYRDVLYEGTVICLNLVKKKAVELANKGQKDLDSGTSLFSIINKLQDQGKKRDSAAKLAEAIESLTEEKPKAKKVKKSDTEDKVKGTEKSKKAKKTDQPSTSTTKKSCIHPQKLAEISALLGEEDEITVAQMSFASSKPNTKACTLTEKEQVSPEIGSVKEPPREVTQPHHATLLHSESEPTPSFYVPSPPRQNSTPRKMLTILESPRKSPRLKSAVHDPTQRVTLPLETDRAARETPREVTQPHHATLLHSESGPTSSYYVPRQISTPRKMFTILESPKKSQRLKSAVHDPTQRVTLPLETDRAARETPREVTQPHHATLLHSESGPTSSYYVPRQNSTPRKMLTILETPRKSPRLKSAVHDPTQRVTLPLETDRAARETPREVTQPHHATLLHSESGPTPSYYESTPPRQNSTPRKMLTKLKTPRRSPRLQLAAQESGIQRGPCSSLLFENISPIKDGESQWDGTFVNSFNIIDWNERDSNAAPICSQSELESTNFGANAQRSFPEQLDNELAPAPLQLQQAHNLCVLLGITPREASIASTVLRKIAYLLGDEASTMGPRSINHSPTDSDRMSSFSLETESSPVISKNMGMLIKDPSDPERFRNVIVDKPKERELKLKAAASKKPTYTMLNGLLELVFSRKELSSSSGLGLRKKKENSPKGQVLNGPPLDALKVSAIKEYLRYHCEQNSWTNLTAAEFNMTITNKITNSRRIASKHPSLKVPQIAVKGTSTSAEK